MAGGGDAPDTVPSGHFRDIFRATGSPRLLVREKVRPTGGFRRPIREKTRPASPKMPKFGCFQRTGRTFSRSRPQSGPAGRTFSRTGCGDVATLKPTTPLHPLMLANVKPPSPLLAPQQGTLETAITTATKKHAKYTHFSPAKAMAVSDNRTPGLQAPAAPPTCSYKPAPQKTRMQFDWVKFQRSLKTLQFQRSDFKI